MTISAISLAIEGVLFKRAQASGVSVVEYSLFSKIFLGICSGIVILLMKKDPVRDMPRDKRSAVFIRSVAGIGVTVCFLTCLKFLPLSLLVILF